MMEPRHPLSDGTSYPAIDKETLWDRYFVAAPAQRRRSVELYNVVKLAYERWRQRSSDRLASPYDGGQSTGLATNAGTHRDRQGNRLNISRCREDGGEEIVVPAGGFAFEADAASGWSFLEHVEGHVFEDGGVVGGVVLADTRFVLAEGHVEHPVETVLDAPVSANGFGQLAGIGGERGDEMAGFGAGLAVEGALSADHDDGAQGRPVGVQFPQPVDVVRRPTAAFLDAAMVGVDGGVMIEAGVGEVAGELFLEEQLNVAVQGPLIGLQGQHVIGALVDNLLGDGRLAADGVDGDDGALERQQVEQLGNKR